MLALAHLVRRHEVVLQGVAQAPKRLVIFIVCTPPSHGTCQNQLHIARQAQAVERASQGEAPAFAQLVLAQALKAPQRLVVRVQRRVRLPEAAVENAACFATLRGEARPVVSSRHDNYSHGPVRRARRNSWSRVRFRFSAATLRLCTTLVLAPFTLRPDREERRQSQQVDGSLRRAATPVVTRLRPRTSKCWRVLRRSNTDSVCGFAAAAVGLPIAHDARSQGCCQS